MSKAGRAVLEDFSIYPILLMALVVALGYPSIQGLTSDFAKIGALLVSARHDISLTRNTISEATRVVEVGI